MITDAPVRIEDYAIGDDAHSCGGVVTFTGVVRAHNNGRTVTGIHYDCYREMAETEMRRVVQEVKELCGVTELLAVHRVGELQPGDLALLVVAAAPRRKAAFDAAQRAVEEIKRSVPIWKKEFYADAPSGWL